MHITRMNTLKQEHEKCMKQPKTFFQTCRPNEPNCVPAINLKIVITALVIIIGGSILSVLIMIIERMDYNNQFHTCSNIKNNIPPKCFMKQQGVLILSSVVLFISVIIVFALLGHYTIGQNHNNKWFFLLKLILYLIIYSFSLNKENVAFEKSIKFHNLKIFL